MSEVLKIWSIQDDIDGNFVWKLNDNFSASSSRKITLQSSNIEWVETYLYQDETIVKTHYFSKGEITIPVDSDLDLSIFKNTTHQFSIYDLDGKYSFKGGDFDLDPDEDSLKSDYEWDNVFEELDYIGTDSSQVTLSSINIKE